MLVEHTFVTTAEDQDTLKAAADYLTFLGYRIRSQAADSVEAVRGKPTPNTRKVSKMPQTVALTCDRGRVTVVASIVPFKGKELPVYAGLLTALAVGLEQFLARGVQAQEASAQWRQRDAEAGKVWTTAEKGCLITLVIIMGLCILLAILAVIMSSTL